MFLFDEKSFLSAAKTGKIVPLVYVRPVRHETPVSVYAKLAQGRHSFLLDSAGPPDSLCEYSFVGFDPIEVFTINMCDPLPILKQVVDRYSPGPIDLNIPITGGVFGYVSYDVARYIEDLPCLNKDDLAFPEAVFMVPGKLVVFDHRQGSVYVIANKLIGKDPALDLRNATKDIEWMNQKLDGEITLEEIESAIAPTQDIRSNLTVDRYEEIVSRAKEYIFAGDIFQANLSVRFDIEYQESPFDLYRRLRQINPSAFAAYMDLGDFQLVSSSPERLIVLRDGVAQTRPIAGTRRRGEDAIEDERLTTDLLLNDKERAEHVMLVDLERNDLGRVCRYGSVRPSEMMTIERYSHVIHITSNVVGQLEEGKDQFDLFRGMFPGGTITGCPKVRCMEIIEELEPTRRGPYTGSIGYFGFNGNMDMNIVIRTFVLKDGRAYIQAGAGIVADSDPRREYFECVSKANALFNSLGLTEGTTQWERLPTSMEILYQP